MSMIPPEPVYPVSGNSQDSANYLSQSILHNNAVAQQSAAQITSSIINAQIEFSQVVSPEVGNRYAAALNGMGCSIVGTFIGLAIFGGGAALIGTSMPKKDYRNDEPLNVGGVVGGCFMIIVGGVITTLFLAVFKSCWDEAGALSSIYQERLAANYLRDQSSAADFSYQRIDSSSV